MLTAHIPTDTLSLWIILNMPFLRFFITISALLITLGALSQGDSGQGKKSQKNTIKGEIFGQVLDSLTNQPMEYVTVSLIDVSENSVITGIITTAKGKYSLTDVAAGRYKLRFDFVGYSSKTAGPIEISKEKLTAPMKVIRLSSTLALDEVIIEGSKPEITYEIDKKVINVGDQDTESGQSAIEILETIPSVSVDIDGNMNLRGNSSFTLLIDGKPSAMEVADALISIPASTIENIEIITNASAKYEAEGVSGIVNIITKKKKLEGTSLLANITAGNYENYSGDLAINVNKKKFSYNVSGSFNLRNRPRNIETARSSVIEGDNNEIIGNGEDVRDGGNNNFGGEISYSPNNGHSFTVSAKIGMREYNNGNDIRFIESSNGAIVRDYQNDEKAVRSFDTFDGNFTYRYNIKRNSKHYIEFNSILRSRDGFEESITQFIDNGILTGVQRYTEDGPTDMTRYNLDYVLAIGDDHGFEMGSQYQIGQSGDIGRSYSLDIASNEYILNEQFSSDVDYSRDIMAVYSLYRGKQDKLGYQIGLRAEQTIRNITSNNFEDFVEINRWDYFPSAHLSYQLPEESQLMLSYSRRINRPRSWYFEPFFTWVSAYQLRSGNPDLVPEYIDAIELNWSKALKKKSNVSVETYFRKVADVINRINREYDGNILLTQPFNVGESISIGVEPAINMRPKKWWKFNLGMNFYQYNITGELQDVSFDRSSFNWSTRMSNTFKFGKEWQFQFSPQFNSASVTPQGTAKANFQANTSLKKGFQNGKYAISVQARDVFSTSIRESESSFGNTSVLDIREPRTPFVSLTLSVKLNNYKRKMGGPRVDDAF